MIKTYLGWIVTIEFVLVIVCNIPAYFLFSEKPQVPPSRVAKMRRCSFKNTCKYIFGKNSFYLLFISFSTSSAILFQLIAMIGPTMELYNDEVIFSSYTFSNLSLEILWPNWSNDLPSRPHWLSLSMHKFIRKPSF